MTELSNEWLQYLVQHGAALNDEVPAQIVGFGPQLADSSPPFDFVAPLSHLGLIAATGEDAPSFLHSQLTNDVEHLSQNEAKLAGYCSPKGRMLATLLMWRSPDAILLQMPRQIQSAVQKRLQMYVLRAKAKMLDATNEFVILGLVGFEAGRLLAEFFPHLPESPYDKHDSEAGTLIRLTDVGGRPRFQWITSQATAMAAWPKVTSSLRATGPNAWRLTEIQAGIASVTADTQEQFVPQMINFEIVGGVNFKKGCYPGQEIVARSQYLGKLKRRTVLATIAGTQARPSMEVYDSIDVEQPCGMIVNAEISGVNEMECLVEIKMESLERASVHLGAANGPELRIKSLPYSLVARNG